MTASVRASMRERLSEYAEAHRSKRNELCHFVGVPLIVFGAARLLGAVRLANLAGHEISLTHALVPGLLAYYLVQARWLGLCTAALIMLLSGAGLAVPFGVGCAAFVFGWLVQFIGHAHYEHRKPAFMQNLVHLVVGPAWLVERAFWSDVRHDSRVSSHPSLR
ncbi:MAG TPA: Mpo1-like protein [Polyangiaceae bacterium]|nr:Mpo1-like protein [Polyangiaceae bacterium]